MYSRKLLKELEKYGVVTCSECKHRKRKDWNIYSANTLCSEECKWNAIHKLIAEANEEMKKHIVQLLP